MTPLIIIYLIIIAALVWLVSSYMFGDVGEILKKLIENAKKEIKGE